MSNLNVTLSAFDAIKHVDENGIEFWCARELQILLGYQKWQKFESVIRKVIDSFHLLGKNPQEHLTQTGKMIERGNGAKFEAIEYKLTKVACYLISQECDSSKEPVALAKRYFAAMTIFAEQTIKNKTDVEANTELFSHKNYQLAQEIGRKSIELARENNLLKAEVLELRKRLLKLEAPALPPSDGVRLKELLRCCGVTIDSNDGNLFSGIALNLRKAVENGELPKNAIVRPGRYQYSQLMHQWVKSWVRKHS
jgi:hypothetical protein